MKDILLFNTHVNLITLALWILVPIELIRFFYLMFEKDNRILLDEAEFRGDIKQ